MRPPGNLRAARAPACQVRLAVDSRHMITVSCACTATVIGRRLLWEPGQAYAAWQAWHVARGQIPPGPGNPGDEL